MMDDKCKTCIYEDGEYNKMCRSCKDHCDYVEDIFKKEEEEKHEIREYVSQ